MYIHIKAKTKAKKEEYKQISEDHIEISVKEPAERNLANTRILELLRLRHVGKSVRMISGHHSPSKIVSVE